MGEMAYFRDVQHPARSTFTESTVIALKLWAILAYNSAEKYDDAKQIEEFCFAPAEKNKYQMKITSAPRKVDNEMEEIKKSHPLLADRLAGQNSNSQALKDEIQKDCEDKNTWYTWNKCNKLGANGNDFSNEVSQ